MIYRLDNRRSGAMVPLVAFCIVVLLGFVAMAIDLGVIAVSRSQCQIAADAAALAGARDLNGDTSNSNNSTAASTEAFTVAENNKVLSSVVQASQVTVTIGSYYYDNTLTPPAFVIYANSKPASENYTLCQATVSSGNQPTFFGKVFKMTGYNVSATATAAHRPRDVAVVLDLSTSMRFDSLLGTPHDSDRTQCMNPDTVYPKFGPYYGQDTLVYYNGTPAVQADTGEIQGACNFTVTTNDGPPIVDDFYQDTTAFGATQSAFDNYPTTPTPTPDTYATTPGGDNYLFPKGSSSPPYAQTVYDLTNATHNAPNKIPDPTWENAGSTGGYGANFKGYTYGPRFFGKTFFIWPPDPRTGKDWRFRFFLDPSGGQVVDNTHLWDTSGNWLAPSSSTYKINYQAIFSWLTNNDGHSGTNPFPAQLRAGGIMYYDHVPQPSDANFSTLNTRFWASSPSSPLSDPDERFWKDYIDYVIGVQQTGSSSWNQIVKQTGYGDDFQWGTVQATVRPPLSDGNPQRYMSYGDNPRRPLLHFWFGPLTFLDFTGNTNQGRYWWPGTTHEAPMWQLRATVQTSLDDIKNNHPNDNVALIFFGNPGRSAGSGVWNRTVIGMGHGIAHNTSMKDTLFWSRYNLSNLTTEINPYNLGGQDPYMMPIADGGTNWGYALMLTFNQFSGLASLRTYAGSPQASYPNEAGGGGRQGSQKLVIFETDGVVNQRCAGGFDSSGGAYNSFYNVRIDPSGANSNEYLTDNSRDNTWVNADADAQVVATQLCALDSATTPGYSTVRKPLLIHTIGFGSLFDPVNSTNSAQIQALKGLEQLQYTGGKAGGEQATATTPIVDNKLIYGDFTTRMTKLKKTLNSIMEDGQQVTLLK